MNKNTNKIYKEYKTKTDVKYSLADAEFYLFMWVKDFKKILSKEQLEMFNKLKQLAKIYQRERKLDIIEFVVKHCTK